MLPRKDKGNESLVDVAVIGAGPAGSTIGRLLAEWGYSVLTLNRPQRAKPCLAETLPPSSRKLFNFLGILNSIDEGGFYRTSGNTAWWGNTEKREEHYSGPQQSWGYQVLRKEFDQLLSNLAEKSGARIYSNAIVRHVDLNSDDSARLEFDFQNGVRREIHSRFVLDCSGRAGVLARKEFRKMEPGYETLALSGVWKRNGGWEEVNKTHTLVETYRDGWAWSVPLSSEVRHFTVMIDSRAARKPRERGLQTIYHEALGKTKHVRKILAGAEMQQPPWSCDASLYTAHCFAGPQFLLVGDAASFIDPLSSYGVKKALASAWLGAVTVNTCLKHPELRSLWSFFRTVRGRSTPVI